MISALVLLQDHLNRQIDLYAGVMRALEDAFGTYQGGQISINAYLETVIGMEQACRRQRSLWFRLCDGSVILRGLIRAERDAFRETCAALAWCRNCAFKQRDSDLAACLTMAADRLKPGAVQPVLLAAC